MNRSIVKTAASRRGRDEELDDQKKQTPGVAESLYSEDKREMEMAGRQDWVEDLVHHLPGRLLPGTKNARLCPRGPCLPTLTGFLRLLTLLISQVAPTRPSVPRSVCLPAFGFLWPVVTSLLASSWMQLPFSKVSSFSR